MIPKDHLQAIYSKKANMTEADPKRYPTSFIGNRITLSPSIIKPELSEAEIRQMS